MPAGYKLNLEGKIFGKLLVLRKSLIVKARRASFWECRCSCGNVVVIEGIHLTKKNPTLSCGCLRIIKATTHGFSKLPEYRTWARMKARCLNSNNPKFEYWGGRGITICPEWIQSFERFFSDMGVKPTPEYSLDRINVNGNYEPSNCRWATKKEQVDNRRVKKLEDFTFGQLKEELSRRKPISREWDERFLKLAEHVASWSRDPSTKVGAVIIRPDKTIASVGFNGFSKSSSDSPELYENREEKLSRIIHAEMNGIIHAREPLTGYCLYTWPLAPCDRCSTVVIQSGISRVVFPKSVDDKQERWGESIEKALSYFDECGVEWTEIS